MHNGINNWLTANCAPSLRPRTSFVMFPSIAPPFMDAPTLDPRDEVASIRSAEAVWEREGYYHPRKSLGAGPYPTLLHVIRRIKIFLIFIMARAQVGSILVGRRFKIQRIYKIQTFCLILPNQIYQETTYIFWLLAHTYVYTLKKAIFGFLSISFI